MQDSTRSWRKRAALAACLFAGSIGIAACGTVAASGHGATSTATSTPASTTSIGPPAVKPLVAPKTTAAEDTEYLADVAKADGSLATYVQNKGNVALRALLVDGSAFCAFLQRGGGIDNAILSVAVGAKSVESSTKLPLTVTTFNTVESVALLELCPAELSLVPASVRTKLGVLRKELSG
jgi:hypothetical protein